LLNLYVPVALVMPLLRVESSIVKVTAGNGSPLCLITRTSIEQLPALFRDLPALAFCCCGRCRGCSRLGGVTSGLLSSGFPQLPSLFGGLPPGHWALALSGERETTANNNNRNNLLRRNEKIISVYFLRNENLS
jgi:hypothetical protein